jgi:hypothetical protein
LGSCESICCLSLKTGSLLGIGIFGL